MLHTRGNKLTWLGHATFRITTPSGKAIIVDPWVKTFQILELDAERRYAHVVDATDEVVSRVPGCDGLTLDIGALWKELDVLSE